MPADPKTGGRSRTRDVTLAPALPAGPGLVVFVPLAPKVDVPDTAAADGTIAGRLSDTVRAGFPLQFCLGYHLLVSTLNVVQDDCDVNPPQARSHKHPPISLGDRLALALMVIGLCLPLRELPLAFQAGEYLHAHFKRPPTRVFHLYHGGVEGGTLCVSA